MGDHFPALLPLAHPGFFVGIVAYQVVDLGDLVGLKNMLHEHGSHQRGGGVGLKRFIVSDLVNIGAVVGHDPDLRGDWFAIQPAAIREICRPSDSRVSGGNTGSLGLRKPQPKLSKY